MKKVKHTLPTWKRAKQRFLIVMGSSSCVTGIAFPVDSLPDWVEDNPSLRLATDFWQAKTLTTPNGHGLQLYQRTGIISSSSAMLPHVQKDVLMKNAGHCFLPAVEKLRENMRRRKLSVFLRQNVDLLSETTNFSFFPCLRIWSINKPTVWINWRSGTGETRRHENLSSGKEKKGTIDASSEWQQLEESSRVWCQK